MKKDVLLSFLGLVCGYGIYCCAPAYGQNKLGEAEVSPVRQGPPAGTGWHFVMTVGQNWFGNFVSVGDTLLLDCPRSPERNSNAYLYSFNLGKTWDSMPPLPNFIAKTFLSGHDALHMGGIVSRRSDTTFHCIRSYDFGRSWDTIGQFPAYPSLALSEPRSEFRNLRINPANPEDLWFDSFLDNGFSGSHRVAGNMYVRSSDGGLTWNVVGKPPTPGSGQGSISEVMFDERDPSLWYMAVAPSDQTSDPIYYQTVNDGRSFRQIQRWGDEAGQGFSGELRVWTSGPIGKLGNLQYDPNATGANYIHPPGDPVGYSSYLPDDPDSAVPEFVDIFSKVAKRDTLYHQGAGFIQQLRDPDSYIFEPYEYLKADDSARHDFKFWAALTFDGGRTVTTLLQNVEVFLDKVTGRCYAVYHRDTSHIPHPITNPDSADYWYSDKFAGLLGFKSSVSARPSSAQLMQIDPAIVSDRARVRVRIDAPDHLQIDLFDIQGKKVLRIYEGVQEATINEYILEVGHTLPEGIYMVRMLTSKGTQVRKIIKY